MKNSDSLGDALASLVARIIAFAIHTWVSWSILSSVFLLPVTWAQVAGAYFLLSSIRFLLLD